MDLTKEDVIKEAQEQLEMLLDNFYSESNNVIQSLFDLGVTIYKERMNDKVHN